MPIYYPQIYSIANFIFHGSIPLKNLKNTVPKQDAVVQHFVIYLRVHLKFD